MVGPQEGYELDQFIKSAPEPVNEMEAEINKFVMQIDNPTWTKIVKYLLQNGMIVFMIILLVKATTMRSAEV